MEQPVSEDMAAFGIGGELRLVQRHEGQFAVHRHGLCRAQQPARAGRFDPFLAGDQGNFLVSLDCADLVIDLARQQAEREADRPARMGAQPLDREMRLAGIGRAQHSPDAAFALVGGVIGFHAVLFGIAHALPQPLLRESQQLATQLSR